MTENGHGKPFIDVTLVEIHLTLKKVDVQPIRHWKSGLLMNSTTFVCIAPFPLSMDTTILLPGGRVPVQLETRRKTNEIYIKVSTPRNSKQRAVGHWKAQECC
jgi:hypothetical protein